MKCHLFTLFATIVFLSSCATFSEPVPVYLFGDAASPSSATRTIVITPDTKYVYVEGGETVNFVANDQAFAWTFAPQGGFYFDLSRISPPGALERPVMAVAPTPDRYLPSGPSR